MKFTVRGDLAPPPGRCGHGQGCFYVEREAEVFLYTMAFDRLTSMAMRPEDSVSLITEVADHL
jgi:hypothetical protein